MNEVATIPQGMPPALLASVGKYLDSMGNKLSKYHREQFIEICSAFQLNPFIREVYGIPYGDKFSIIVGYEVYLKRAETSGQLAGWRSWTEGEGKNLVGCVEITRKDWAAPFRHEVYFSEYDQSNSMWKTKPRTMIKKVAIAQGFRMAFPVELGGMPYTSDELPAVVENTYQKPAGALPEVSSAPVRAKITRDEGKAIMAALEAAGGTVDVLFMAFRITRLGELYADQVDKVYSWIGKLDSLDPVDTTTGELPMDAGDIQYVSSETCDECGNPFINGACRELACPAGRPE